MSRWILLAVPAVLGVCTPGPEMPTPNGFDFGYRLPAEQVTFVRSDTSELRIGTPMGETEMTLTSTATVSARFESVPEAEAIRVTMTLTALDAGIGNAMVPDASIDESQADGHLAFHLSPWGETEILETRGDFFNAEEIHLFFPRLPKSSPAVGMTWTDTISYESALMGMGVRRTSRITYTLASMKAGPGGNLLEIRAEGTSETTMLGEAQEMAMVGNLQGTQSGTLFLDAETRLLVLAEWTRIISGDVDVPGTDNPGIGITEESHFTIRQEGVALPPEVVRP